MSTLTKLPPHPHQHHHHHDHCRPGFPHPIPGPFTRSKYGVQLQRDYDLENRKYEIKSAKEYEQEVKSCEDEKNKEDDVIPAPLKKKTAADLNVGIVGGGMAGLYAALLLQDLGIKSHIFEASPRLGGRVYTKYFKDHDGSDPNKAAYYKYVDVGESRIPKMDIMDRFTGEKTYYSLYNVLNRHNHNKGEILIKLIPYINENPSNLKLYNGQKLTIKDLELEKAKHHKSHEKDKLFDPFHFGTKYGGPVPDAYLTESHEKHLMQVLGKIVDTLEGDKDSFCQGFEGLKKVDALSVRAFLAGHCPDFNKKSLPSAVVNWIETLSTSTDRFEYAFTEFLLNHFEYGKHLIEEKKEHHKKEIKWQCVEGGMSRFVDVLEKHLLIRSSSAHRKDDHPEGTDGDDTGEEGTDAIISKGLKVVSIAPDAKDRTKLTITPVDVESGENAKVESFDHVINATPLSIMRNMDMNDCDLSFMQREALRSVHYETAVQNVFICLLSDNAGAVIWGHESTPITEDTNTCVYGLPRHYWCECPALVNGNKPKLILNFGGTVFDRVELLILDWVDGAVTVSDSANNIVLFSASRAGGPLAGEEFVGYNHLNLLQVAPSVVPTFVPSSVPTTKPSWIPTTKPTIPTIVPTQTPTMVPTTTVPSAVPSVTPSIVPSAAPSFTAQYTITLTAKTFKYFEVRVYTHDNLRIFPVSYELEYCPENAGIAVWNEQTTEDTNTCVYGYPRNFWCECAAVADEKPKLVLHMGHTVFDRVELLLLNWEDGEVTVTDEANHETFLSATHDGVGNEFVTFGNLNLEHAAAPVRRLLRGG